ncbi:hypothetical protein COE15_26890 [Bacillus cereus]|uniref:hypothetical protein n=1 Tax=Bacillus sp. AFS023182 TaxID=2033492 RepID=UPI000BF372A3|nr:hypothetical protein [Bacillus sp. AFS023182]PFE03255.1 hypothetical protein CN288_13440 [Bacillus sp. AFS023182]PGX90205.1 hypothetical protein COE15_26890 [Bacillus cereus]
MKRRIGTAVVGLSVLGFGIFGVADGNDGGIVQAASIGERGGAPVYSHADFPASSYNHGDVPAPKLEADGDTGAPVYTHADHWSPSYSYGHTGALEYSHADLPAPKLEEHGDVPAPKLEASEAQAN